ncbi:MAG TPA: hypothetical protein IAB79_08090 [Candidatus Faecousia excrementipullorum]|mgnify:CR=1 FL=1|nr:hypothetical protein [Candidatus Faecousia excrementipullorum]
MKKFLSLILSFALLLSASMPVFATESNSVSEETINSELLTRGYPQIVLDTMDYSSKLDLYDENVGFMGAVITYYDESTSSFIDIHVEEDGSYISPRGQIPTSDLSLTFTYSRSPMIPGATLDYIKVSYNYNWLKLPFFRWQDPISVSWDSSKFEMVSNSFYKVDMYDGFIENATTGAVSGPYIGQIHSSEYGYANASSSGVTWYADLKGYNGITPTKLYGYGTFKLAPKNTTAAGSTILYGHYVHPKMDFGISVNVVSYGGFSISGGSNYDERGNQKTISW